MDSCYSCGVRFDGTNNSLEHIINNSIGGRWKTRGLLCIACNNLFGSGIDQVLNDQLENFTDLLGISRQRERKNIAVAMKSSEGDFKIVGKGLRPHSKLTTILPDGRKITEFVEDSQFKEFIEEKKAQLKKKYSISSERYYEEKPAGEYYKIQNSLSNEEFDIGFGGEDFFRSIIKIAVNFYIKLGYEIEWVQRAISVIRKEAPNEMAYFFYVRPERYEIHNLGENEVSHIIHLRGDKSKRVLYAYVELFNMQNVLIRLNSDYQGPDINKTYAIDLKTGEEMQKDVNIILGRHHFEILHLIGRDNMKEKEARYRRVEKLIEKMQLRE